MKFKRIKFEPYLETLTEAYYKTLSYTLTNNEVPGLEDHRNELAFMESIGLLKIFLNLDRRVTHIELTNTAIRYSYDRWNARKNAIFNYLFGLTSGIAIGVSVALIVSVLGA